MQNHRMDLLILVGVCCLIGFVVYILTTKIPMPPYWATAIQIVALIVIVLYLLGRFGFRVPNILP